MLGHYVNKIEIKGTFFANKTNSKFISKNMNPTEVNYNFLRLYFANLVKRA